MPGLTFNPDGSINFGMTGEVGAYGAGTDFTGFAGPSVQRPSFLSNPGLNKKGSRLKDHRSIIPDLNLHNAAKAEPETERAEE